MFSCFLPSLPLFLPPTASSISNSSSLSYFPLPLLFLLFFITPIFALPLLPPTFLLTRSLHPAYYGLSAFSFHSLDFSLFPPSSPFASLDILTGSSSTVNHLFSFLGFRFLCIILFIVLYLLLQISFSFSLSIFLIYSFRFLIVFSLFAL